MLRGVIFDFNGVLLWDTRLQEEVWAQFAPTRPTPASARRYSTSSAGA